MNETDNIQYVPIRESIYEELSQLFQYKGNVFSDDDRREFIRLNDKTVSQNGEILLSLRSDIESLKGKDDECCITYRVINEVTQSVIIIMSDCLVITKYFLLADTDYDKRFMRGKMKVILNEGFKKLYGFEDKSRKKSEWRKLGDVIDFFPQSHQLEYEKLSDLLDRHSKSSSWWKDERNLETHLDTEELYESRCEEVFESVVMNDALTLVGVLYMVQNFMIDSYACICNILLEKSKNQKVKNAG